MASTTSISSTASTLTIGTSSGTLAYRRFGKTRGGPSLLLTQRFRGTMDHWDPLLLDLLATHREVVLFDNVGVGRSAGSPAKSIAEQARGAINLLDALRIEQADVLGWSMGGAVAQSLALDFPQRIRRLVVAGSGPGGVADAPAAPERVWEVSGKPVNDDADFLYLFFHDTDSSQRAGQQHLARLQARTEPFSPPVAVQTVAAQVGAIRAWGAGIENALPRLGDMVQPVLVANGQFDRMVHAYNSYVMAQRLPNAKLILYPDAGHAFLFQHAQAFADDALGFLAS